MSDPAAEIARLIEGASRITVLTGAGMSAESGIPTFRGSHNGLWERFDPTELATPEAWRADNALVWGWYLWRMAMVRTAAPNAGHLALARLAGRKDLAIVTQNVDDLHERAGSRAVTHVHGELFAVRCFDCGKPQPEPELPSASDPRLRVSPPHCRGCGGDVRPGVVWFGESLPEAAWRQALERVGQSDLVLVIGTSGLVQPAASLPGLARRAGATVVEINPVETALTPICDLSWRSTAAAGLPTAIPS